MSISPSLDLIGFYTLDDPLTPRPLRLSPSVDWLNTEAAFLLARGRWQPPAPMLLRAQSGRQVADVLWTTFPPIFCVSSRVVNLLMENSISGWSVYPVEIIGRKNEPLPGYHGFAVIGPECQRDRSRSQVITKLNAVGRSTQVYKGLYFNESQWDGSDFFMVRPFGGIVVTEKVYRLIKGANVTNTQLTLLAEVELDVMLDQFEKSE